MAEADTLLGEVQATDGVATNGGGFDPGVVSPGTDHAYAGTTFARADLVIDGADNTKITSAGDPFAADDNGNRIQITAGTGFTPGFYTIKAVAAGVAELDRACGTVGSTGGTGGIGPLDILTAAYINASPAGITIWVKNNGTMTLGGSINGTADGAMALPCAVIGYNATRGDNPTGTDRPLIAQGAYYWILDDYWRRQNLRITLTEETGVRSDTGGHFVNCSINNSSETAGRVAMKLSGYAMMVDGCDVQSINGHGIVHPGGHFGQVIRNSYVHDCGDAGINMSTNATVTIEHCIIEAIGEAGIQFTTGSGVTIEQCTINGCVDGIDLGDVQDARVRNNIISHCTTVGAKANAASARHVFDYNNWHGNTADVSNVTKGANATAVDPAFVGADDFRTPSGSGVRDAANGIADGVGAASTPDQGAWQSAGAGGAAGGYMPYTKRHGLQGVT